MKNLSSLLKSIVFLFLALLIFLSLFSYTPKDISFLVAPPPKEIHNFVGIAGAYVGFFLFFFLGYTSFFIPFYFFFLSLDRLGLVRFSGLGRSKIVNIISLLLFLVFLSALAGLFFDNDTTIFHYGGTVGFLLSTFFKKYLGIQGSFITLLLLVIINSLLLFGFFFVDLMRGVKLLFVKIVSFLKSRKEKRQIKRKSAKPKKKAGPVFVERKVPEEEIKPKIKVYTPSPILSGEAKKSVKEEVKEKVAVSEKESKSIFDPAIYILPSTDILKVPPSLNYREVKEDIEENIKNLEDTLSDFGVEAKVVSVQKGPVVTMYELQPYPGTKIQKISALADDIALAMKSSQVRIVAPLVGRGTVGIEVPNERKHFVYLREILEEKTFIDSPSKLTLIIGKDVSGNPVIADLKEMPHLLIAGTTGSGKTVCVNSLISSILFKARPDEVKFILIDPKMVELAHFYGIPHLLHPIISEAKKAFVCLSWAVEEMERRYRLLAEDGARNIDIYNKNGARLPYIVIVVDELADLMVVAKESIETAIQRLAQLSRAVGIHLILATQRPSVDVVTGVIKANFPARISFKVSSKVDSRTVLDVMGAEKLLGKGDLLFLKPGAAKLIRVQGSFIDDDDIGALTSFLRKQGGPIYEEAILQAEKRKSFDVEKDELFDEAVKVILQARQASASILQRRLRVGYTRAARLLDLMEERGIVGPFCGSKAREILIDPDEFLKEKNAV
jgi:S-DNA-T family DNA segregation ATPase FtsK/SpoIIIE